MEIPGDSGSVSVHTWCFHQRKASLQCLEEIDVIIIFMSWESSHFKRSCVSRYFTKYMNVMLAREMKGSI